jgi:hypothetical protein
VLPTPRQKFYFGFNPFAARKHVQCETRGQQSSDAMKHSGKSLKGVIRLATTPDRICEWVRWEWMVETNIRHLKSARAKDHTFRNTILTPGNTLCWFVRQIAYGNVACAAMHRLAGETFSDAAWCHARDRLPIELIQQVHHV